MLDHEIREACAVAYEFGRRIRRLRVSCRTETRTMSEWVSFVNRTNAAYRQQVINAHYAGRRCRN